MKSNRKWLAVAAGVLILSGAVIFGITQYARAGALRAALGDVYESALLDTQLRLSEIEIKLGKLQVAQSQSQSVSLLSSVARGAGEMTANLSLMPLSHDAMGDTLKFANQLSDYADALLMRLANGQPLSETDADQISSLSREVSALYVRLSGALPEASGAALADADKTGVFYADTDTKNRALEKTGQSEDGYPTLIYDGPFSDARKTGEARALPGYDVAPDEMEYVAMRMAGKGAASATRVADQGGLIPAGIYSVETPDNALWVAVTQKGGLPLWMAPETASFSVQMELSECESRASDALEALGFHSLTATYWQVYDGMAVINFAAMQDGVILYPDLVKAQVRMDTGDLVGLEALGYMMNHTTRHTLEPLIGAEDAAGMVSARLTVKRERLCVIPTHDGETLCYEFLGEYEGDDYLIYIDAQDGQEIEILRVIEHETGLLTA